MHSVAHKSVDGARECTNGQPRRFITVPIRFHPDVFEMIRKRAVREGSCFGDVVAELVELALDRRGLGG